VRLPLGEQVPPGLRRRILAGRYERGESRAVLLHLEPDDVVLELGGGLGYLAALCALRVGSERVSTYEANPELLPLLERTLAANGVSPRVEHAVVGLAEGTSTFFVEHHFDSSSVIRRSVEGRPVAVPQVDIRRVIEEVRPTFLIMDVEGAELDLVPAIPWGGIRKLLLEVHPALVGEVAVRRILDVLDGAGFVEQRWSSTTRKKLFRRRSPEGFAGGGGNA
jgi:FkbM family methyltransferase